MPLKFDPVLKGLARRRPADYAALMGLAGLGPPTPLDVDLSAVSAATDVLFAFGRPPTAVAALDFQAGPDPHVDDRVLMYQGVLRHTYHVPVFSTVVLLRPEAYRPTMTGAVRYDLAEAGGRMDFAYRLVKLWETPAEAFLGGPVGCAR